jgi:membrane-associated protease RseP (regulator of RpoE activity)
MPTLFAVHKWGTYLMALTFDVKVLRFSIGWLPLGGNVPILDESHGPVEAAERCRAFDLKSLLARSLILAGMTSHVSRADQQVWAAYWGLWDFLSVSLGLLHLLPLPLRGGGHLMYYLWESLIGKLVYSNWVKVSPKVGLTLLLALMATTLVNDGMRLWR